MGACCSARSRNRTKPSIDARCKRIVLINYDDDDDGDDDDGDDDEAEYRCKVQEISPCKL